MAETQTKPRTGPGGPAKARKPFFLKQKLMLRVVYALIPLAVSGIYFYGWRVVAVMGVCFAGGITTEWLMARQRGAQVSMAVLVTCMLYSLAMPPLVPLWIALVGIVVAILFAKEVFGGFGRNFANPAILGRAFVYVCFPVPLTAQFVPVFRDWPGGFARWSILDGGGLPEYLAGAGQAAADAVSQASPQWINREFGDAFSLKATSYWELFVGDIGGLWQDPAGQLRMYSGGSIGEGAAWLIIIAAAYLLVTRTANWRLMLGGLLGLSAASLLFRHLLGYDGAGQVPPLGFSLLAGTTLYVLVFMFTDPVSAPKRKSAQWAYAFLMGFLVIFLRWKGVFVAAASFAILLGNMLAPLLDIGAQQLAAWRKARSAAPAAAGAKAK